MRLAEFIIALAGKHRTLEKFKAALQKNGAEFPVSSAPFFFCSSNVRKCLKYVASPGFVRDQLAAAHPDYEPSSEEEERLELFYFIFGGKKKYFDLIWASSFHLCVFAGLPLCRQGKL